MKNASLSLIAILFAIQLSAQSNDRTILFGGAINYYPVFDTYTESFSGSQTIRELLLTFRTPTSGLFEIEDEVQVQYERYFERELPVPQLGAGFSMQWVSKEEVFHEIALTRLSMSRSNYFHQFSYLDSTSQPVSLVDGFEQKSFTAAIRYEYGKYFGDPKRSGIRFGISAGIEPTLYAYSFTPYSSSSFPVKARILTVELAVVPMLEARLSKRAFLDFKLIPNILLADFGYLRTENPILTRDQQELTREYDPPEINLAASVLLRYVIKERKRGKR